MVVNNYLSEKISFTLNAGFMENRNFQHPFPPMFDLDKLDEQYEIQLDYDPNGNLRRIRKVKRIDYGSIVTVVVICLVILARLAFIL